MIPKDYECEGQLSIWDLMTETKPEIRPAKYMKPDDSICEGCKWREVEGRELEVDVETCHTWVYKCPGTACMNWKHGTPINISCEKPDHKAVVWYDEEDKPYCFDRNFLPSLEQVVDIIQDEYGIKFEKGICDWDDTGRTVYSYKLKKCELEVSELNYMFEPFARFIDISCQAQKEGFGSPCDSLYHVYRSMNKAFKMDERLRKAK